MKGTGILRPKTLLASAAIACVLAGQAQAAPIACFDQAEAKQAQLRQMQQEFTVAALSCAAPAGAASFTDRYNAFIGKFADALKTNAHLLLVHFSQHGGSPGFDTWMTKLANLASVQAATQPDYCQRNAASLDLAMAVEPTRIVDFAVLNTQASELVRVCDQRRAAKPVHAKPNGDVVGMAGPAAAAALRD